MMCTRFFLVPACAIAALGAASSLAQTSERSGPAANVAPITSCYAAAEKAHLGLKIVVYADRQPVAQSSKLVHVMDAIARHHASPSLDLRYNVAGAKALRSAMDCIFKSGRVTLSALTLNRAFLELNVRPIDVLQLESASAPEAILSFTGLGTTCTGQDAVVFEGEGQRAVLPVTAYLEHDFQGGIDAAVSVCNPGPLDPCTGTCSGEGVNCACTGGEGSCASGIQDFSEGGSDGIAVVIAG